MKFRAFLVLGVLVVAAACVSTKAVMLDKNVKYPPVPWEEVKVFLSEKDVPGEFVKIAIIKAEGKEGVTTAEKMLEEMKKKAGALGADAIILEEIKDPGDVERMADSISGGLGLGSRKGRAIAIKFKTSKKEKK